MKIMNGIKRILTVGAVLLLFVLLAACQKQPPETMLQPPIEGLTWGMTQDEVIAVLKLTGEAIGEDAAQ